MADTSYLNIPTPEIPDVPETPPIEASNYPSQDVAGNPEVLKIRIQNPADTDSTLAADSIALINEDRTNLANTMPITENGVIAAGPEISKSGALEESIRALFTNE